MQRVAKLVIVDGGGKYLLLHRDNHPIFLDDPDIPGGTVETGEDPIKAALREVFEESGIVIAESEVRKLYQGDEYSADGSEDSLYIVNLNHRPKVIISWEHLSAEWVDKNEFLAKAKNANDAYMHMVHDILNKA